jgi:uncharacterized protein (TIGR04222 family)
MNPFTLYGPHFLLLYLVSGVALLLALAWRRRMAEDGQLPGLELGDPYLIAYLSGGPAHATRVAVEALVGRGG